MKGSGALCLEDLALTSQGLHGRCAELLMEALGSLGWWEVHLSGAVLCM